MNHDLKDNLSKHNFDELDEIKKILKAICKMVSHSMRDKIRDMTIFHNDPTLPIMKLNAIFVSQTVRLTLIKWMTSYNCVQMQLPVPATSPKSFIDLDASQ